MKRRRFMKLWNKITLIKSAIIGAIFSFLLSSKASAQFEGLQPVYGINAGTIPSPTTKEVLTRLIAYLAGAIIIFVVTPVLGLIWYNKSGKKKEWLRIVALLLLIIGAGLFLLCVAIFIIPRLPNR
jgi:cytochrome c biogenesis protein CcdA